jgi:hypothetical protein
MLTPKTQAKTRFNPSRFGGPAPVRTWLSALGLAGALAAGCASSNGHGPATERPEIGIRRGGSWSTYSVSPPRIVGPTATLELKDGHLHGSLASRSLDLRMNGPEVTGFGPGGPVRVDIRMNGGETEVEGLWNGAPVHLRFTPEGVRGSVVVARGRTGARELSCFYALDRRESDGSLAGSSTCAGMPQETRLQVSARVAELLSPTELAVFLTAALGAPPGMNNEWR